MLDYIRKTGVRFALLGFFPFSIIFGAQSAAAIQPIVKRDGSTIKASFPNLQSDLRWMIEDDTGATCATGVVSKLSQAIVLEKISPAANLRLFVYDQNNHPTLISLPGKRLVSTRKKLPNSAVFYQVPVRTYYARGNGKEQSGRLDDLTAARLKEMREFGADYVWLTGVVEHAALENSDPEVVKGDAGSYYAIYDSWDVAKSIGNLDSFVAAVQRVHAAGLSVIIDFVPNHTARFHRTDVPCKQGIDFGLNDAKNQFAFKDNNYFYIQNSTFQPPKQNEIPGADGKFDTDIFQDDIQFETPAKVTGNDIVSSSPQFGDWFETAKLNYGFDFVARTGKYTPTPRTWKQMVDIGNYWLKLGVDGFRLDIAHAVPLEFWRYFSAELRKVNPEVFLLAEAYEKDERMKVPGFTYRNFLDAGIDSVYNSEFYWALLTQAAHEQSNSMRNATPSGFPALSTKILEKGYLFTNYLENHDEVRLASRPFSPWLGTNDQRASLGLALSAFSFLTPGNVLMHGGQELAEDASVSGHSRSGREGHTSIYDYIYQSQTKQWNDGTRPDWMRVLHNSYQKLLTLKHLPLFSARTSAKSRSFYDLDELNGSKAQSQWIAAYIRVFNGEAALVVVNSDPFNGHEAAFHLTNTDGQDSHGILKALNITNDSSRYIFRDVFSREGWTPHDPNITGDGIPGWILYRPGNVPSGIYLGEIPPSTTLVLKIQKSDRR